LVTTYSDIRLTLSLYLNSAPIMLATIAHDKQSYGSIATK
jgi:hypothetical protein